VSIEGGLKQRFGNYTLVVGCLGEYLKVNDSILFENTTLAYLGASHTYKFPPPIPTRHYTYGKHVPIQIEYCMAVENTLI
jgi:hypothetical protein